MAASLKKILVYGGSGALGNQLVNHFKSKNHVNFLNKVYR